jgi:hypothetical protein
MNTLHEAFKMGQVAKRYYKLLDGRKLTNERARELFKQSQHRIDFNILEKVINDIYQEQLNKF